MTAAAQGADRQIELRQFRIDGEAALAAAPPETQCVALHQFEHRVERRRFERRTRCRARSKQEWRLQRASRRGSSKAEVGRQVHRFAIGQTSGRQPLNRSSRLFAGFQPARELTSRIRVHSVELCALVEKRERLIVTLQLGDVLDRLAGAALEGGPQRHASAGNAHRLGVRVKGSPKAGRNTPPKNANPGAEGASIWKNASKSAASRNNATAILRSEALLDNGSYSSASSSRAAAGSRAATPCSSASAASPSHLPPGVGLAPWICNV